MMSLDNLGFTEPTAVQKKSIPFILKSKKDLIALAQTGTGKTAAFGLPILNQIDTNKKDLQAIILCPTRELCLQISEDIKKLAKNSKNISITAVYGGARIDLQIRSLKKRTHIVVGTPGRVCDLIRRKALKLRSIKWLVLDEADEMLDMGFKDDLDAIINETPKTKQTLLFSATMSKSVNSIARKYMGEAEEISIGEKNVGAEKVTHEYYVVNTRDRFDALKRILDYIPGVYGILFCRTRIETGRVADKLKQANYDTEALHGDISQVMRTKIMDRFKRKQIRLLVATDVAARGIDVSDLTHVINYNLPDQNEGYTHRSGRTGRAEKSGVSISIVGPREIGKIKTLEGIIGKTFEYKKVPSGKEICRKQIDNFLKDLENIEIKEDGNKEYWQEIIERLKKYNKEDLIKLFVTQKISRLLDSYKNTRDLNTKPLAARERMSDQDSVGLKINFGKKHGFDIKGLFALVNSKKNLKGVEIGKINLMPEFSIFTVNKKQGDRVLSGLKGARYRGKMIVIERSDMAISYGEKRRGGGGRGFNRGRKRFRKNR